MGTQKRCFELQALPGAVLMAAAASCPWGWPAGWGRIPLQPLARGLTQDESPNLSVPPFPPLCNGDDRDSACCEGHDELGRRAGQVVGARREGPRHPGLSMRWGSEGSPHLAENRT